MIFSLKAEGGNATSLLGYSACDLCCLFICLLCSGCNNMLVGGGVREKERWAGWPTELREQETAATLPKRKLLMAKIGDEDWKCCLAVKLDHEGNHFLRREDWTLPGGMQHCREEMTPAGISYSSYFSNSIHNILRFLRDSSRSTAGFLWKPSLLLPLPLQLRVLIMGEVKRRHWTDNKMQVRIWSVMTGQSHHTVNCFLHFL